MKHNPGFLALVEQAKRRIKECSIAEVKAKLDRGEVFIDSLRQMGYQNVLSMDGGIRAWREAGYPLDSGQG